MFAPTLARIAVMMRRMLTILMIRQMLRMLMAKMEDIGEN
jgi:hypothetical protein